MKSGETIDGDEPDTIERQTQRIVHRNGRVCVFGHGMYMEVRIFPFQFLRIAIVGINYS
nr:MAG TPA: hypothetical protein [Caudoviricetes sp.]